MVERISHVRKERGREKKNITQRREIPRSLGMTGLWGYSRRCQAALEKAEEEIGEEGQEGGRDGAGEDEGIADEGHAAEDERAETAGADGGGDGGDADGDDGGGANSGEDNGERKRETHAE